MSLFDWRDGVVFVLAKKGVVAIVFFELFIRDSWISNVDAYLDDWFSNAELDAPAVAAHEDINATAVAWGECVEWVAFDVSVKHAGDVKV